jgi:carbon storage regulator
MLVLTRKLSETVLIGEDVRVTIVRLETGQVRLGIDAPRSVSVLRAELKGRPVASAEAPERSPPGDREGFKPPAALPGTGIRRRARFR